MTEAEFFRQVVELAALLGYQYAHFRPAMTKRGWRTPVQGPLGAGFPDLVLVSARRRRVIYAELKSDAGKPTPAQIMVRDLLSAAGDEAYIWQPKDWDAIVAILRDRPEPEGETNGA